MMRRLLVTTLLLLASAAPAHAGQLILSWTDNSADEQGFKVERCLVISPATSCANFLQIATVPALIDAGETKTWVSAGLTVGTTWGFRVRAYNQTGNSDYSNEAYGTVPVPLAPLDPTNLVVQ